MNEELFECLYCRKEFNGSQILNHRCTAPTPQKLETGERLGDAKAADKFIDNHSMVITPDEHVLAYDCWNAGAAHARSQQKPSESDVMRPSDDVIKLSATRELLSDYDDDIGKLNKKISALEKELAEQTGKLAKEIMQNVSLSMELSAALASKAAAEGALEKIAEPMPGLSDLFCALRRKEIAREVLAQLKEKKE